MKMKTFASLAILLFLTACGGGNAFFVTIVFPEGAKDLAARVTVMAILPGETATCVALQSGSASPGDDGFEVEDEVGFDMPLGADPRPLKVLTKGRRLFYAEAELESGVVYLRGCTEQEAGGSGVNEVAIELDWVQPPCASDEDCNNDGQWCNGVYHCNDHMCELEVPDCVDDDPCTQDLCNEDLDQCENPPVEEPPNQEGPQGDVSCSDGMDNDCDGLTDELDPECIVCTEDTDCDDANDCTDDSCQEPDCVFTFVAEGTGCEDGEYCSVDDACNDSGRCVAGTGRDCSALDGVCLEGVCDDGQDECVTQPSEEGASCEDGVYCTVDETCTGGVCGGGSTRDCDDGHDCTVDQCNLGDDVCENAPVNSVCDDSIDCTTDSCDPADGCHNDPVHSACQDGVNCTVDTCSAIDGCHSVPDDGLCDDQVYCTADICDLVSGCSNTAEDARCDDGAFCTTEVCDPVDDCQYTPNAGGCPTYHIGPDVDTCPHEDATGTPTDACDYTGVGGLTAAVGAAPADGARFLLYDDGGIPSEYDACTLAIPANSYLAAAPGIDPSQVLVVCQEPDVENGVLHLIGDNIHIAWITIINLAGSETAISAWPAENDPVGSTGGHLIENVTGLALHAERSGSNSLQEPLWLGSDTTVRNCYFSGFYENEWELAHADNVRFLNNTFVYYQNAGSPNLGPPPVDSIQGTDGMVFANNVFLSLTRQETHFFIGDATTTNLTVAGNVIEGYDALFADPPPTDPTVVVQDNFFAEAPLESPLEPLFLSDAAQQASSLVPGEGVSLDGVPIDGRTDILPGAFQNRSSRSSPRRMTIMVGDGNCAGSCDFGPGDSNEIQQAVYSSWPGGLIEIYPGTYAGNAIIPWGIALQGMTDDPSEVVLESALEHGLWSYYEMWERHNSVLVALHAMDTPVLMEKFTILVHSDGQADDRGVMIEGYGTRVPPSRHELRRLVILSGVPDTPGLFQGLYLGDMTRVLDVLIYGEFASCIRFGVRSYDTQPTPVTSPQVINLSCRLVGTGDHLPEAALDIASVENAVLVNLAIETESPASFLRAQAQSDGPIDLPTSYTLHSITLRGWDDYSEDFDHTLAGFGETDVDTLAPGDPFFQSSSDSRLANGCTAIDNGVDPASVDAALSAGVSLDGVDRQGRSIDRGCYEQGQ